MEINLENISLILNKAIELYPRYDEIYISIDKRKVNNKYVQVPILEGIIYVEYACDSHYMIIDLEEFINKNFK